MKAIFATSMEGGFGYEGRLPWPKVKEDMEHFRALTHGEYILMGYNTYMSLPSLPYRTPIIVSRDLIPRQLWLPPSADILKNIKSFEDCFGVEVILIGGASLLTLEFLKECTEIHHTTIMGTFPHDVKIDDDILAYLSTLEGEILKETDNCIIRKYTK